MNISYKEEYPPLDYISVLWFDSIHLRMNAIGTILSILKHTETVYGYKYTSELIRKSAMDVRTSFEIDNGILKYNIYGLNERLQGELPAQVINDLIYDRIELEDAWEKCSEYLDNVEIEGDIGEYDEINKIEATKKDKTTVEESAKMNLKEAKRILEGKGYRLLKESEAIDKGFVQNLITDIENIPNFYDGYDEPINYTVKSITLNTKVKPEVALAIDIEGVEKPLIIGFAKCSFAGCGNYTVFRCKDINDTRISPIGHSCETLDDAYDCLLNCAAERIKKIANGEIK